ncbi:A/G-specific adenine glycosylase [Candidatus Nomurabacteria bacterium]|nr:A/G-specific adenine glycosylase [Candidatus Nomurabacteria bacterium]
MIKQSSTKEIQKFKNLVLDYYAHNGRHNLPWRKKSRTPYQVLVSEIMLQQTQVDRVIPFFRAWMKQFPNFKKLAQASQAEILKYWKGLGYNSRALRLHKLANIITQEYGGRLPSDRKILETLPGIGPYTAGAIRVFAFGKSDVFIETNIRRAFIYHFFHDTQGVDDHAILELVAYSVPDHEIFTWYSALMDYGSTLPKILKKNPNVRSKHYTKQSKFEGSDRQIRGKILEIVLKEEKIPQTKLFNQLGSEKIRYKKIIDQMIDEGFLEKKKG